MKPLEKSEGLSGMLLLFRKLVQGRKKITFIGCPGFCTPFAELFGYVVRNNRRELIFIPNLRKDMAVNVEMTDYGMQTGKKADPSSDTVVILGGLATPKMDIDVNGVKLMIDEITKDYKDRQIIGVCIGGVFQKAGWDRLIDFDHLIDADMEVTDYGKNEVF